MLTIYIYRKDKKCYDERVKYIFSPLEISKQRDISLASAKVFCVRKEKKGEFIRLKKNMYITKNDFQSLSQEEQFQIANLLQTPSYISLLTALSYYDLTTQLIPDTIESVAIKRTKSFSVAGKAFEFFKIKKELFSDFRKEKKFFIGTKEKVFLDCVYLMSLGKYSIDLGAVDKEKLSIPLLKKLIKKYPKKAQNFFQKLDL